MADPFARTCGLEGFRQRFGAVGRALRRADTRGGETATAIAAWARPAC